MTTSRTNSPTHTAISHLRMALLCFVLAAASGVLFRFGAASMVDLGSLRLGDIRHAHSHLMFFGWVTPVLMALIATRAGRPSERGWWWLVQLALAFGMLSFPCFLLWGYRTAAIGPAQMPVAVIASTLSMFVWYGFAWMYWRRRDRLEATPARRLWDLAVIVLALCTIGGWARGALAGMGVEDPFWGAAAVHSFVDPFVDGWLGAGTLGAIYFAVDADGGRRARWATRLVAVGLSGSFLLGIPIQLVPWQVRIVGSIAGVALAAGLLVHTALLWNQTRDWRLRIPLAALGLKSAALALAALPWVARWAEGAGLRIPYLHVFLLGFVSLGLVEAARRAFLPKHTDIPTWPLYAGVGILLATLLPATRLWPAGLTPDARLVIVALGTVPLTVAGVVFWFQLRRTRGTS